MLPATFVEGFHQKDNIIKMKYNLLGNTGLEVSILSLGGGALSPFYDCTDEEEAIKTVVDAIRRGVNYIDTAPYYGQGRSETILGKALKLVPRQAYYIATKVARYEMDYDRMFDFSSEKTKSSVENSLKLLGVDYIDVIQVHDIEFSQTPEIILTETLPALLEMKNNGKVRFIGITGYPLTVLEDVLLKSTVKIDTVLSYCRNTLITTDIKEFIDTFKAKGVGIISAASHAMGLLTNKGPQAWNPATDEIKSTCVKANEYCQSKGIDLARLALWFSLTNKNIATHLVGMNSRELLDSNMSVVINGLSKDEEKCLREIIEKFFSLLEIRNWEGIEVSKYWEHMGQKTIN